MVAGGDRATRCLTVLAVAVVVIGTALPLSAEQFVVDLRVSSPLPADVPFPGWYLRQVQGEISERWQGQGRDGNQPQVVVEIGRDGNIRGLVVEKSSGNPLYDQALLRAITEATPFPPLPEVFKEGFLRVHLATRKSN